MWLIWSTLEGWKAESTLEPPGSLYLEMVASNAHIPSATLLFTLKNCKRLQKLCACSANDHVLQSFEFFFWWQDLSFFLFASLWWEDFRLEKLVFCFGNFNPRAMLDWIETELLFPWKMFVRDWNLSDLEANHHWPNAPIILQILVWILKTEVTSNYPWKKCN